MSHQGGTPGPAGGLNDRGLPALLPVRSNLVFAFSEPVDHPRSGPLRDASIPTWIPSSTRTASIPSRAGTNTAGARCPSVPPPVPPAPDTLPADTLVFHPAYDRPSDSLKVRPAPGAFIHRGHPPYRGGQRGEGQGRQSPWTSGWTSAACRKGPSTPSGRSGWTRECSAWLPACPPRPRPAGTRTARFACASTASSGCRRPGARTASPSSTWTPCAGIPTAACGSAPPPGARRKYDFQFLALEDGDSTLVFRTRPKLAARETVTVSLSGAILDVDGLSLDGNGDGFPSAFYSSRGYLRRLPLQLLHQGGGVLRLSQSLPAPGPAPCGEGDHHLQEHQHPARLRRRPGGRPAHPFHDRGSGLQLRSPPGAGSSRGAAFPPWNGTCGTIPAPWPAPGFTFSPSSAANPRSCARARSPSSVSHPSGQPREPRRPGFNPETANAGFPSFRWPERREFGAITCRF